MRSFVLWLAAALSLVATPARAEWREASTRHFTVYSDGSEESLHKAAADLEKFDFMLRFMSKLGGAKLQERPQIKLKVYLMRSMSDVQALMPYGGGGIAGFYDGVVRGPVAVGVRKDPTASFTAERVLFHEYAHHFMRQNFPATYPPWYVEGFAEYYGATRILDNDVIEVGHAADERHWSFLDARWLPIHKLLTAKSPADIRGMGDMIYSQGWLLVHYFASNRGRSGQLTKYLEAINAGRSYKQAVEAAFGPDASELDRELRKYSKRSRLMTVSYPFKMIDIGPVRVRTLRPAEEALFRSDVSLSVGLLDRNVRGFVFGVRKTAARFPGDPYALAILTEAERLAGERDAALATVERWLAVSPNAPRALMHKGELQIEALVEARSRDMSAWEAARGLLFDAHKRDPRDPLILVAYYNSFVSQGVMPPPGAQNGLFRALELVPQDDELRYQLAYDFEQRGMVPEAIAVIRPAAFGLHAAGEESGYNKRRREQFERRYRLAGEEKRETAREMLTRLEGKLAQGAAAS